MRPAARKPICATKEARFSWQTVKAYRKMPKKAHAQAAVMAETDAHATHTAEPDLKDPSLYLNRELSLLAFQHRVLEEAEDESNPLL
ncbi:MAG TPA: hypothetical protein VLW65_15220, partial [Bryobacteraceae bacterium]|nr:hypothetical protein [Bryobacteraceae bacterium]